MKFSPRLKEVLEHLCLGLDSIETAKVMWVVPSTIKSQVHKLLVQTGTKSKAELIAMAFNEGWVEPNKNYSEIREQKLKDKVYKLIGKKER
jgi:DNA-binding NarL/FixJ family response regulator